MHRVGLTAHQHHPVVVDDALVTEQLTADLGGAIHVAAVQKGRYRNQQRRIIVRHVGGMKTVRIFLGDHVGADAPGHEPGMHHQRVCTISAARKLMLCATPRMKNSLSASRMWEMARSRVAP